MVHKRQHLSVQCIALDVFSCCDVHGTPKIIYHTRTLANNSLNPIAHYKSILDPMQDVICPVHTVISICSILDGQFGIVNLL